MKNLFLLSTTILFSFILFPQFVWGQCSVDANVTTPGVYQNDNYCFVNGAWNAVTWQFKNYDEISAQGVYVTVDSVRLDSIINLPCGIKWTTSKQTVDTNNNRFHQLENGCIFLYGYANDTVGSYATDIYVTAYVQGLGAVSQHLSTIGTYVYTRLVNQGTACSAPDTNNFVTPSCHLVAATYDAHVGIDESKGAAANLTNYPNPFSGTTDVVFVTLKSQPMTFTVYDLLGKAVSQQKIQTVSGKNVISFNRKGLQSGVYFYTISNGSQTFTNKMVITE